MTLRVLLVAMAVSLISASCASAQEPPLRSGIDATFAPDVGPMARALVLGESDLAPDDAAAGTATPRPRRRRTRGGRELGHEAAAES